MIDKIALSKRFSGYSEIFQDCNIKEDLKAMSYVLASMSEEKFSELLDKEAFNLPGMDKLKGLFKKPGDPEKAKPGEVSTSPQQSAQNIKEKYQEAGPSGKLLTMFDYKDIQNAYQALPVSAKKLVDRYITRWKMGDLVGKSAAEEKEALFEDKSPAGVYRALSDTLNNFSKKYDTALLPEILQGKLKDLKSGIDTIESSPERLPKNVTPEEQSAIDRQNKSAPLSQQDLDDDKKINTFLQVMDKHFKADLQRDITPAIKNEYVKMTGDVVGQLKGDIEQGFRDSSPGATYQKKSPYAPVEKVFEKKPSPVSAPVAPVKKPSVNKPVSPVAPVKKPSAKKPVSPVAPVKKPSVNKPVSAPVAPVKKPSAKKPVSPVAQPAAPKASPKAAPKSNRTLDVDQLNDLLKMEPSTKKSRPKVNVAASDNNVSASEGVYMNPRMIDIDQDSDEIKKLSLILANNKL